MDSLCPKIEPKFMIFLYKFLFHKIEKYENELFDKFSEISFFFLLIPIKNHSLTYQYYQIKIYIKKP